MNSFQVISTFGRRTPTLLHSLSVSPPAYIDIDSTPDSAVPIPHNENDEARNETYAATKACTHWRGR